MELLVATWTMRLAIVAAAAVGAISYSAGTPPLESIDRAVAAAFVFTIAGRWLIGALEPPEVRLLRMRRRREAERSKGAGKPAKGKSKDGASKDVAKSASDRPASRTAGAGSARAA